MEYFYSIAGLAMNVLVWSAVLFAVCIISKKLTKRLKKKKLSIVLYGVISGVMLIFSTYTIAIDFMMVGSGFKEGLNYWSWNIDKEAKEWAMTCEGELVTYK